MIIDQMIGDNVTEYERRAEDPCWQHKQECVAMFTIDSHNTSYLYRREDNTYYWQHCRKEAEDDLFVDCLLYTSPSPRDTALSRMPSSA